MRRGLHPTNRLCIATPWRMATDLGQVQEVLVGAPNIAVSTPLPPSNVEPPEPTPVYNWDVAYPEGLDFLEDEFEDC